MAPLLPQTALQASSARDYFKFIKPRLLMHAEAGMGQQILLSALLDKFEGSKLFIQVAYFRLLLVA